MNADEEQSGQSKLAEKSSSAAKVLGALDLFSVDEPVLSATEIAARLHLTRATSYRYLKILCDAGLLLSLGRSDFCLGPKIVQLDRQVQLSDPLVAAGRPIMEGALAETDWDAFLLCSLAGTTVLCVHHEVRRGSDIALQRTRGMPFPLFRGPASMVILANLGAAQIRNLYFQDPRGENANIIGNWDGFRKRLRAIKKSGYAISINEFQTGLVGIASPLFRPEGSVIGSIAAVAPEGLLAIKHEGELANTVKDAAARVSRQLQVELSRWDNPAIRR